MKNSKGNNSGLAHEIGSSFKLAGKIFGKIISVILSIVLTVMLIGLITGAIVGSVFAVYVRNNIDYSIDEIDAMIGSQDMTTKIYYMDYTDRENRIGTPVEIEDYRIYAKENRLYVSYNDIPTYLIDAFISIEDHRFPNHKGVDWIRTVGAAKQFFTGQDMYGGSTITQQLIKNATGDDDVTIQRKIQEILRALQLEKEKDKTEILEMYLNLIYLSQGCYGVQSAAYTYFGKDVSELTLIECAAIAGITQAPTKWDPIINPENNAYRRDVILNRMYELGKITYQEYISAYGQELELNVQTETLVNSTNSWYKDAVIEETIDLLMEEYGYSEEVAENMIYTSGLQIYTAMDPKIQAILEEEFANEENFQKVDDSAVQPQCSMTVIDPYTGDVLGLVGGRGEKTSNRILNYATQTTRSPGSSIKPLSVYAPAIDLGYINYGTVIDDTPATFGVETENEDGSITYSRPDGYPKNYSNKYAGLVNVNYAVSQSLNTVAYKVLDKVGLDYSFDFVKNKLGMNSFIERMELTGGSVITDKDYSALALGGMNYGVTVLELTAAYSIFQNDGIYSSPKIVLKILDSEGNVIVDNESDSRIVISGQTASVMTKLMQNVVTSGTASSITLKSQIDVAGKTGTTSDDNDRWFVGYTPYYIGGVWFGYEMPKSLSSFSASVSPAVKIWDIVMTRIHEEIINESELTGIPLEKFDYSDLVSATYCKDSGKLLTDACKADPRGSRAETGYFTKSTVPTQYCDCHVLVDYDVTHGGIATSKCSGTQKVGLLNITDRSFKFPIYVTDAQYVYRDVSAYTVLCTDPNNAFFANELPEGTYAGTSNVAQQYNRICQSHCLPGMTMSGAILNNSDDDDYEDEENDRDGGSSAPDGYIW